MCKRKKILFSIPFAFGGNPATESGPRALLSMLKKYSLLDGIETITLDQRFDESPASFLSRCEQDLAYCLRANPKRVCVLGGNHLSALPLYNIMSKKGGSRILTLDAHMDCRQDINYTHASFLTHIVGCGHRIYLVGAREQITIPSRVKKQISIYPKAVDFILSGDTISDISLLDLDVDVFDDAFFHSYCDYLPEGISESEIYQMMDFALEKKCSILSISEYAPCYDNDLADARKLVTLIQYFFSEEVTV